jgi:hypothetical protein
VVIDPLCLESRVLEACHVDRTPAQQPSFGVAVPIADKVVDEMEGRVVDGTRTGVHLESAHVCEPMLPAVPFGPPVV